MDHEKDEFSGKYIAKIFNLKKFRQGNVISDWFVFVSCKESEMCFT